MVACALAVAGCHRDARARLWIGGDVHLGTRGAPAAARLAPLAEVLAGATGVINLEGPVADAAGPGRLANGAALVPGLAPRVRVAGVANNHAADAGPDGAARTIAVLRAAGIAPAGERAGAAVIDLDGLRVVVSAHDLSRGTPAGLGAELALARTQGDVLIAMFHTDGPPSYLPRPELRDAVARALRAGAAVVVAQGSHALAAVERRDRAVIAWGLGNLLFDCDCTDERDGLIVRVDLDASGVVDAAVIPVDAGLHGEPARLAADAALTFDLLASLRSSPLARSGASARILATPP
ncbi:MAG: CapA family protein [Deltaproteobacteria bacterium]|nr:CapA family protein [Deltaproteobacteria bacterium]